MASEPNLVRQLYFKVKAPNTGPSWLRGSMQGNALGGASIARPNDMGFWGSAERDRSR